MDYAEDGRLMGMGKELWNAQFPYSVFGAIIRIINSDMKKFNEIADENKAHALDKVVSKLC